MGLSKPKIFDRGIGPHALPLIAGSGFYLLEQLSFHAC